MRNTGHCRLVLQRRIPRNRLSIHFRFMGGPIAPVLQVVELEP